MSNLLSVVWKTLSSTQARRYEYALAVMVYEAVRTGLGHP